MANFIFGFILGMCILGIYYSDQGLETVIDNSGLHASKLTSKTRLEPLIQLTQIDSITYDTTFIYKLK